MIGGVPAGSLEYDCRQLENTPHITVVAFRAPFQWLVYKPLHLCKFKATTPASICIDRHTEPY
jgi:hypothetical protein